MNRFVRMSPLSRAVLGLLLLVLVLLLAVNLATFAMIQRTAAFNDDIEHIQSVRLAIKDIRSLLIDAETGQRGFMLTGRVDYLEIHDQAVAQLPAAFDSLGALTEADTELKARIERLRELSDRRKASLAEGVELVRSGRIGEAVQNIRSGEGKRMMDALREEIRQIDAIEAARVVQRTGRSEWAAGMTMAVNALAGLLILVLAAASVWLVWRYVQELQRAHFELDRLNAGLENEVRDRTSDLTRANEEIQRFAYIVSHDLRAPLVNIVGYTAEMEQIAGMLEPQLARLEAEAPHLIGEGVAPAVREDIPEALGFIRASSSKMDRLINAILKLSRDGRRNLSREPLDMTALAQGVADSVRHQTDAAGAEVVVHPLPSIESDRLAVEQILGNMIDNAVKYLSPDRPGRIVVDGEVAPDGDVVYRIADNGRGVDPRDHERIFELFRRAGRQDQPGEGLGLAFVRSSIRRLGGDAWVESGLNEGSVFFLRFPARLKLTGRD